MSETYPISELQDLEKQFQETHGETHPNYHMKHAAELAIAVSQIEVPDAYEEELSPVDRINAATDTVSARAAEVMHLYNSHKELDQEAYAQYREATKEFGEALAAVEWTMLAPANADQVLRCMFTVEYTTTQTRHTTRPEETVRVPSVLEYIATKVPEEIQREQYHYKEGIHPSALNIQLRTTEYDYQKFDAAGKILNHAYALDRSVMDVPEGEDLAIDRLTQLFGRAEIALKSLPERPRDSSPEAVAAYEVQCERVVATIFNELGLGEKMWTAFRSASRSRLTKRFDEGARFDSRKMEKRLERIIINATHVSAENIKAVDEAFGIVNLDNYTPETLQTLISLVEGDEDILRSMRESNTTVVFADALGDHNGAFEDQAQTAIRNDGTVVYFEVQQKSDFYRRMLLLKKKDIKPSTMIIAAHGEPGALMFGSAQIGGFNLTSDDKTKEGANIDISQARFDRLMSTEFMQPNKGETDDELTGRIQVVLASCSSDKKPGIVRPSVAQTVSRGIRHPGVDIYGATGVTWLGTTEPGTWTFNGFSMRKDALYSNASKYESGKLLNKRKAVETVRIGGKAA